MSRELVYQISAQEEGRPILSLLRGPLSFSSAQIRRMKASGVISLDGAPAFTNQKARAGQVLRCRLPEEPPSPHILPVPGPADIRYEDEDLLILEKPAGVPVHPSQGHFTDSLANFLAYEMEQRGQSFVFRAANRLDRHTSGLLAVAKSGYVHSLLISQLHSGQFHREYLALACGAPQPACGVIDAPILDVPGQLKRIVSPEGASAQTHYRVLERRGPYSLLRLWLETGRTHQIRVHLAHIGCPLAGDFLYGTELPGLLSGHALHSALIRLRQPITKRLIEIESPMRREMAQFFSELPQ